MEKKKIIIYSVVAVLVLGIGIFLGIKLSKGSDDKNPSNTGSTVLENNDNTSAKKEDTDQENVNSVGIIDEEDNSGSVIMESDVKASDIGKPIMPGDEDVTPVDNDEKNKNDGNETGSSHDGKDTDNKNDPDDNNNTGNIDEGKKPEKNSVSGDKEENSGNKTGEEISHGYDNTEKDPDKENITGDDKKADENSTVDAPDKNTDKDTNNDTNNDNNDTKDNDNKEENKDDNNDNIKDPETVVIKKPATVLNTGKLTEKGNGYTGTKGTGDYNYGEALQKSLLFYELQRSGDLPDNVRCNWRGDSCVNDGSDAGLDLSGGWYDAGDNVKFNLPMSYTAAMLGWSIIDDAKAYEESGQLSYALENIKWANDYFIKCHPSDTVYYYQVGDGNQDHSYWGAAETVEYRMNRPSYKVTSSNPGSAVCGETAASLAICSVVYKNIDRSYSDKCLKHAKSLYKFARDTKSDAGYTAANGFYNSWSGFYDELAWAGAWLYCATGDKTYITNAEEDFKNAGHDSKWCMCWDDVHIGAALMLAKITEKNTYKDELEEHLDWWSGVSSDHITYSPKGLAWLDSWGSLRYATTASFIALTYVESGLCTSSKTDKYIKFAEKQANYALGSSGRSYMVGFGKNAPENPHHRTAQGSYCDNMNEPSKARHTLYGALVGGPDANDGYVDTVSDYNKNEVACDYNAGFTGLLAKMYKKYHGQTLKDFGAVEPVDINEFYVEGGINVDGTDFMELRAFICNVSAWPARGGEKLEFRYYVDLSEIYKAGGSAADVTVTTNYMAAGKSAGLKCWDEDKHIYYLSVEFSDSVIYPGGQDKYKKEIQVRLKSNKGVWNNENDPSFVNMTKGGSSLLTGTALYEKGQLVFGTEPKKGKNSGTTVIVDNGTDKEDKNDNKDNDNDKNGSGNEGKDNGGNKDDDKDTGIKDGTAKNASVTVTIEYDNASSSASAISGRMNILNTSDGSLSLKDLKIMFYFTNEDSKDLTFECYHTCINGANGSYSQLSGCGGDFKKASGKNADTVCEISYSDKAVLEKGDTLVCNFAIHHTDWSNMNLSNDHSMAKPENIVITNKKETIFGNKP